jgi:NADP-dependent aldehyde dehydrogenase
MTITGPDELDATVERAHVAFGLARDVPPATRAEWLEAVAEAMDHEADELVRVAQAETHLAEGRLRGELTRSTFQLRLFAAELLRGEVLDATIDHPDPGWGMGPRPDLRRVNVPLGVVGVFGASNFPFAFSVMGGDSASALAAGCAVVHKIHEAHERLGLRTAEVVVDALSRAGAPSGLFAGVTGRPAGEALVDHPLVTAVAFTGSERVGRLLLDRISARPEPVPFYGELGSTNPVFVTRSAWQARGPEIVDQYVQSFTLGMGQFCTKPGLLFVPTLDDAGRAALRSATSGAAPTPMLTPQLADGFLAARSQMSARPGVEPLVPGGAGEAPAPAVLTSTVRDALRDPGLLHDEMFGPASVVVQYDDESALPAVAAQLSGQLTATIHSEPDDDVSELAGVLASRAGRVIWNAWPTGVTVSYAQHHGGPYPATTSAGTTSVGTAAARRFVRPVAYQGFPDDRLPPALQEANPWRIDRRVDGEWQRAGGTGAAAAR